MTESAEAGPPLRSARLRLSAALWRRPWLKLGLLLAAPVLVFAVVYLGALVSLFISAFWSIDAFTAAVIHTWTLDNFKTLWNDHTYWRLTGPTIGIAAAATLTHALRAFPPAYFIARLATPRLT